MICLKRRAAAVLDYRRRLVEYMDGVDVGDLDVLNGLRVQAVGPECSEERAFAYLNALKDIEDKVPISEDRIKIPFLWSNFEGGNLLSSYDLDYERASVVFNVGISYLNEGAGLLSTGVEKEAGRMFAKASGMFEYIRETFASGYNVPNTCNISTNVLHSLFYSSLALSQGCFVSLAYSSESEEIVSKVAASCSGLYKQALWWIRDSPDILGRPWYIQLQYFYHYYLAIAQWKRAAMLQAFLKYGEQIAWLEIGLESSRKACGLSSKLDKKYHRLSERQRIAIAENLDKMTRENNLIYCEPIPTISNPDDLPGKTMASPIPPVIPDHKPALFLRLVSWQNATRSNQEEAEEQAVAATNILDACKALIQKELDHIQGSFLYSRVLKLTGRRSWPVPPIFFSRGEYENYKTTLLQSRARAEEVLRTQRERLLPGDAAEMRKYEKALLDERKSDQDFLDRYSFYSSIYDLIMTGNLYDIIEKLGLRELEGNLKDLMRIGGEYKKASLYEEEVKRKVEEKRRICCALDGNPTMVASLELSSTEFTSDFMMRAEKKKKTYDTILDGLLRSVSFVSFTPGEWKPSMSIRYEDDSPGGGNFQK